MQMPDRQRRRKIIRYIDRSRTPQSSSRQMAPTTLLVQTFWTLKNWVKMTCSVYLKQQPNRHQNRIFQSLPNVATSLYHTGAGARTTTLVKSLMVLLVNNDILVAQQCWRKVSDSGPDQHMTISIYLCAHICWRPPGNQGLICPKLQSVIPQQKNLNNARS